ncbi:MAG: DUF2231 domain-containing protein [Phycisphaerales bacterium]
MFNIPPLPPWEGMHPLVVHFPIALLMVAPLLVLLAAFWPCKAKPLMVAAWIVITIGAGGTVLAAATGEDTKDAVVGAGEGWYGVMRKHARIGETARNAFVGLWALFTLLTAIVLAFGKPVPRGFMYTACGLYLLLHLPAILILVNAAHLGGRLVHEFGARAPMTKGALPSNMDFDEPD